MKKKIQKLQPLQVTSAQASYEKLMLEMMSKLVSETRQNSLLFKQSLGRSNSPMIIGDYYVGKDRIIHKTDSQDNSISLDRSEQKTVLIQIQEVEESQSGRNLRPKTLKTSPSAVQLGAYRPQQKNGSITQQNQPTIGKILLDLEKRLKQSDELNKRLMDKIDKLSQERQNPQKSIKAIQKKQEELEIIQKAIANKIEQGPGPVPSATDKKSYVILSQILPYSDRREMKVKFKISDIVNQGQFKDEDLKTPTAEWLGQVYRATASICWNMLLNNYLNFEEVKILFTENIVFNFIDFMNELQRMGKTSSMEALTELINTKSVDILDFLCRQYPQTKIQAPNITLRSLLPMIDNQGRIKYDLVSRSGINFTYNASGDYTAQIMSMINFMIDSTSEQSDGFIGYMHQAFQQVFLPLHKRKKLGQMTPEPTETQLPSLEDITSKGKVKAYTKYLIGRKISKNTSKYTDEEIEDGIFFVKSSGVLRIITKWVQQLMEYFTNPEQKIKNSYSEMKDHNGKLVYISALLKNGIHKQILKDRSRLTERINEIKKECYKMEMLLTGETFTTDSTQVHLSEQQISVGMYCSNLKSAISSYICSELNELIHYLLSVPREVREDALGSELQDFKSQARKDLDSLNLVTFKIFDLLRCKMHSNQEEIIWIVQYLLDQSAINKDKFNIVRIKDRLNLGTRDIMINAQINRGLVCQIQLSVTSNTDKKQELLDQYNHFLYELKRSKLGPVTENVSIWSTLEQRYSYFEQLMKQKNKEKPKGKSLRHLCGEQTFNIFKRPIICQCCGNFFSIPKTCLLCVTCEQCNVSLCGQCYYYNYLTLQERKLFIFDKYRLLKMDVMGQLKEYVDTSKPLPPTAFFIKKKFLKKELSFYMAIQKNKNDKIKDAPSIELILVQTIIRNGEIVNRQLNKKEIEARLEKGEFYVKNYQKSELNNYIIFYFDKKENKKFMTLKDLQIELQKPESHHTKILSILREPSYIVDLHLIKKDTEKLREMTSLSKVVNEDKMTVYMFKNLLILTQVCVKGSLLRAEITKKVNTGALKEFANKESDIVNMEHKNMTTEFDELSSRLKPKQYNMFCRNIKKMFLANGSIASIKCFSGFPNLQFVVISENKLTSLEGIESLSQLVSFRFDGNDVESLASFTNLKAMKYLSGNKNKIGSLEGLQNSSQLKNLSLYQNKIVSIEQLQGKSNLQELYLRDNPISDLSIVSTLTGLTKLFIGKTQIVQLPNISSLTKLKSLSLECLELTEIPDIFDGLRLNELWLSNNKITRISNLESQCELVALILSNNQIQKIENIKTLEKLETLRLSGNKITKIQNVKDMDALKWLNLKLNPIDDLGELTRFQTTFKLDYSEELLSEAAKKQRAELQILRETASSAED